MKPMTKKLLLGIPTVTLSAVLACTVAGCGGSAPSGSAGSSGGSAPVEKKAKTYESQTVEVAGITYESVAHGTFYRGDAKKQDGFYLYVKITNNNAKNRTFDSFNVHASPAILRQATRCLVPAKRPCSTTLQARLLMGFTRASTFPRDQISVRARPSACRSAGRSMTIMADRFTEEREYRPFGQIRDNYPKYLLTRDDVIQQRDGIIHANIPEFMQNGKKF